MADNNSQTKRNITVFGTETEFEGTLEFRDQLVITGKFNGSINAPTGDLEIAGTATCNVDSIVANSIEVSGIVSGNMKAADRVEICTGSVVESDIITARFRIANNVEYSGQVTMLEKEPEVDLFSVSSAEYRQAMLIHSDVIK